MIKNNKTIALPYTLLALVLLTPAISFADAPLSGLKSLLTSLGDIIRTGVIPLVATLAFVFFFWGMGQFILHANEEKTRTEGKQKMIWGIIALFVILSIVPILRWIGNTIGIGVPVSGSSSIPSDIQNYNPYDPTNPNQNT